MKKKKVDKILKGVVTAGVALGGASFMTEADMVYAAELGEQGEEEEFEQAGLEQDEEVESPAVEEALDTDTSSDDTTPTEEASTDETAPAEEPAPPAETPAEEGTAKDEASAQELTHQQEQKIAQAEKKLEQADKQDNEKRAEKKEEQAEKKLEKAAEKAAKGEASVEAAPAADAPAEEAAPAEVEAPAEAEAPSEEALAENVALLNGALAKGNAELSEEADVDKEAVNLMLMKAPLLRSSAPAEGESTTEGEQNFANLESEDYQNAIAGLQSATGDLINDTSLTWDELREYVAKYVTADLALRGATDIKFSDWQKGDSSNKHYEVTYLGADGEYHAEYYGYTTADGKVTTSNITIQQKNPHMDDKGAVTFKASEDVAWRTFDYKKDDVKSTIEDKAQTYDEQIQQDSQNSGVASYLTQELEDAINNFRDLEKDLETKDAKTSWRALTVAYAKIYVLMNGGSNPDADVKDWVSYNDAHEDSHNIKVTYTDANNEEKAVYFDYVTFNTEGNWNVKAITRDGAILLKTPKLDENGNVATDGKHMLFEVNGEKTATNTEKGMELIRIYASKASSQAYKALLDISEQIKETMTNQNAANDNTTGNQDGNVTPPEEGNENGSGGTPAAEGNENGSGGTPAAEGNENGSGGTPAAEGNENGSGETPAAEGDETGGGETPAAGGEEAGGGATPAAEDATPGTTIPDAAIPQAPAATSDNTGSTPVQETPATETAQTTTAEENQATQTTQTTQSVNEQTTNASTQTQTANTVNENTEQAPAAQTSRPTVEIGGDKVPLTVGLEKEDGPDVVNIGEKEVAKAAMVGAAEAPAAAGGLWSWILGVIAFITGKTANDKKNDKGAFKKDDKK